MFTTSTFRKPHLLYPVTIVMFICVLVPLVIAFAAPTSRGSTLMASIATDHPTPVHSSTVVPGQNTTFLGSITPNRNIIGAARIFVPAPNEPVEECVAFIFQGYVVYHFGLFDGYWMDRNIPDDQAEVKLKEAVDFLKANCKGSTVKVRRFLRVIGNK